MKRKFADISESLGKIPPSALDLEEAILGALMLEKNAIIEVAGFLRPEHFYSDSHRELFQAILELFQEAGKIDMRTVVAQLRKNGKMELVGGPSAIAELTSKVSSAANIEYHARIVLEYSMKRMLIQLASKIHHDAHEDTSDVFELIDQTNLELQEVLDNAITGKAERKIGEVAYQVVQDIQARQSGHHTGLPTGFNAIDSLLNGLQPTDLIIIAARPGMGKSSLAMQIGKQVSETGNPVGAFLLEMSNKQTVERLAVSETEVDSEKVKKGKLVDYEVTRMIDGLGKLSSLPIYLDDTPMLNIVELRARAMRMKTKYKVKLIIIDYLQLIRGLSTKNGNREQEIALIARTLKGMAKELEIPIIALSQLSRSVETRGGDKRPQLSDLRESGSLEQDSDVVVFLYRPEYYKITVDSDGMPTHGLCEVIVAKHRNGSTDTVKLKFVGRVTKFFDWSTEYQPPAQRMDQSEYVEKHYKNPLPSEKSEDDFKSDDLPF